MRLSQFALALTAVSLLLLCGCSLTNRGPRFVALTIKPVDSYVIINGVEYHHLSPQFVEVRPDRSLLITAYKPGYKEALYAVDYQLSNCGKIDAWASLLIFPAIGLLTDGAWELKENNITITLDPLPEMEELDAEQKARLEAKKRLIETEFQEKALKAGIPPSPEEDRRLQEEAAKAAARTAETAKTEDAAKAAEKAAEKTVEEAAPAPAAEAAVTDAEEEAAKAAAREKAKAEAEIHAREKAKVEAEVRARTEESPAPAPIPAPAAETAAPAATPEAAAPKAETAQPVTDDAVTAPNPATAELEDATLRAAKAEAKAAAEAANQAGQTK